MMMAVVVLVEVEAVTFTDVDVNTADRKERPEGK